MRHTTIAWALLILLGGVISGETRSPERVRVYIETANAWQITGGGGWNSEGGAAGTSGGSRPQTVELMKTFQHRCPEVTITNRRDAADYVVAFDREGGKDPFRKDNKIAVFRKNGDLVNTSSTRSLGNAVKDACSVVLGRAAN